MVCLRVRIASTCRPLPSSRARYFDEKNFVDLVRHSAVAGLFPVEPGRWVAWAICVNDVVLGLLLLLEAGRGLRRAVEHGLQLGQELRQLEVNHRRPRNGRGYQESCAHHLDGLETRLPSALSFIIVIGATGALFLGLLGIIQNDVKRVVAYSTLSQLGYMTVALGASAYSAAVFHLMTHAFFKALLFLGAGSVIIGMHHDQDIRNMGGLRKYMPITWLTFLIGTLALVGTPFFSGFYSKEHIIEAAGEAGIWGSTYAYYATLIGVFVTSLYSFRLYFLVFHGKERFRDVKHDESHGHDDHHAHGGDPHESPWVVTLPLVLLAIPSIFAGIWFVDPLLFGGYFDGIVTVLPEHPAMATLAEHWTDWMAYAVHGFGTLPFWLVVAGAGVFRPSSALRAIHHRDARRPRGGRPA